SDLPGDYRTGKVARRSQTPHEAGARRLVDLRRERRCAPCTRKLSARAGILIPVGLEIWQDVCSIPGMRSCLTLSIAICLALFGFTGCKKQRLAGLSRQELEVAKHALSLSDISLMLRSGSNQHEI